MAVRRLRRQPQYGILVLAIWLILLGLMAMITTFATPPVAMASSRSLPGFSFSSAAERRLTPAADQTLLLRMDEDGKQRVRNGMNLALQLMRRAEAKNLIEHRGKVEPPIRRGPNSLLTLVIAVAVIGITVLIFLGIIAGSLKVLEYGVAPIVEYVGARLFPLLFIPGALPVLALAVLVVGLMFAPRFRDPALFIMALSGPILAILGLWQLPRLIGAVRARGAEVELEGPVLIVSLIVCAFLFVGGLQLMATAEWIGKRQDVSDDDDVDE